MSQCFYIFEEFQGSFLPCFLLMCDQSKIVCICINRFSSHPNLFTSFFLNMCALQLLPEFFFLLLEKRKALQNRPFVLTYVIAEASLLLLLCTKRLLTWKVIYWFYFWMVWKSWLLFSVYILHLKALVSLFQRISTVCYFNT